MGRMYRGDWVDSMQSRFVDELPKKNIKKEDIKDQNFDDSFFNLAHPGLLYSSLSSRRLS